MFSNKKGTELSMNVIIIAAISVLILVILAVLVLRAVDQTGEGTSCMSLGGMCYPGPTGQYIIHNIAFDSTCDNEMDHCYMKLGSISS